MITNIGKRIRVEEGDFDFERDADSIGIVTVTDRRRDKTIVLPANAIAAEKFILAYRRCVEEDIAYRKTEVE